MKIALVYDRVNKWGGAERVLLTLHEIFPEAPLYTSVYSKGKAKWAEVFPEVIPSFLQKAKLFHDKHEYIPFLMPFVFETHDFKEFDIVISVTSESAKGIITGKNTLHICYCLTPTRYLWSGHNVYFKNQLKKQIVRPLIFYLREWDKMAANRPDKFVAISNTVKDRIKKYYFRDSVVIHPPVDTKKFLKRKNQKQDNFYLIVSRLVPYKQVDLAINAFNKTKKDLVIVGTGREENKLKKIANKNIHFVGSISENKLLEYYQKCRALIFPQVEDFGLVAVEANASGAPVIAFNEGGAQDIITENVNGVFFERQDVKSLIKSLERFEKTEFSEKEIIKSAKRFDTKIFKQKINKLIQNERK